MTIKVGSAPDSWGVWFPDDARQIGWEHFLDELAAAGYAWTELGPFGYLPTDRDRLHAELDNRGLRAAGSFVMGDFAEPAGWPEIERQLDGWGQILPALGAGNIVLIDAMYTDLHTGRLVTAAELDDTGFARLVEGVARASRLARERYGLRALFHPHAQTHVETEAQIERLLHATAEIGLSLCFDTGHHAYCGGDPVAFLRRWHRRIPYLHLKSVDGPLRDRVLVENIPFARAVAMGVFVEPAMGLVDFVALRDLLAEIAYDGFAIVEQDMYPAPPGKPLPIAKRTRDYLREIGIG